MSESLEDTLALAAFGLELSGSMASGVGKGLREAPGG
jgi:hypothetical protein